MAENKGLLTEIEDILEPAIDRLYHQNLPDGKYAEIAIKASVGMLKSNLTTQILAKIREVVEGAELTQQEIQDVVDEAWAEGNSPTASGWCKAQLQAILKAIDEED